MASLAALTEDWDHRADELQRLAASLRYSMLADLADGDSLCVEVACGTGFGLELLDRLGVPSVGGDLTAENLSRARAQLPKARLVRHDALRLPYRDGAASTIACLEAIYYLPDLKGFLAEAARALKPGGNLLLTTPNPRRPGFNRSPGSVTYPDARTLAVLMRDAGLQPRLHGAFPWTSRTWPPVIEQVRRMLSRLHLMPRNQKLKEQLKRVVFRSMRQLAPLESVVDPGAFLTDIGVEAVDAPGAPFIVMYAVGTKSCYLQTLALKEAL